MLNKVLRVDKETDITTEHEYVDKFQKTRVILTANAKGECYHNASLGFAFNGPIFQDSFFSDSQRNLYHGLPNASLVFGPNFLSSCSVKLNESQLKSYCSSQSWRRNLVFTQFDQFSHVGKFGNASGLYIKDWVKVDDFSSGDYVSLWDETRSVCVLPAVFNLDVIFVKTSEEKDPQIKIQKIVKRVDIMPWYANKTEERKYSASLRVNFIEAVQETTEFYAEAPVLISFPKNSMYPFRIGTTQYAWTWTLKIGFAVLISLVIL